MNANLDPDRERVLALLRAHGFTAHAVPERDDTRQPDIRANLDEEIYLVEVKRKLDHVDAQDAREAAIEAQGFAHFAERMRPARRYFALIRNCCDQLDKHADSPNAVRVAWVPCVGFDADDQAYFLTVAAYGVGCVADADRPEENPEPTGSIFDVIAMRVTGYCCDYFYQSCFYTLRNVIDALVLEIGDQRVVLINDHSPNAEKVRASPLIALATEIVDPVARPDADRLYADSANDRRDVDATLRHLGGKYGFTRPIEVDMQRHRLVMRYQHPPERSDTGSG